MAGGWRRCPVAMYSNQSGIGPACRCSNGASASQWPSSSMTIWRLQGLPLSRRCPQTPRLRLEKARAPAGAPVAVSMDDDMGAKSIAAPRLLLENPVLRCVKAGRHGVFAVQNVYESAVGPPDTRVEIFLVTDVLGLAKKADSPCANRLHN